MKMACLQPTHVTNNGERTRDLVWTGKTDDDENTSVDWHQQRLRQE